MIRRGNSAIDVGVSSRVVSSYDGVYQVDGRGPGHDDHTATDMVTDAAERLVAGDGAVGERRRASNADAARIPGRGVIGDGAVRGRQPMAAPYPAPLSFVSCLVP